MALAVLSPRRTRFDSGSVLVRFVVDEVVIHFDVLLAMHLSKTPANDQLDAQFIYFIISLLQSSTCFEQRRAHHQEVKLY